MTNVLSSLSVAQLQRAIEIREQIEALNNELDEIQGTPSATPGDGVSRPQRGRKKFSAASRRKMAASQRARWAARKGETIDAAESFPPRRRRVSAAARARMAAAQRARRAAERGQAGLGKWAGKPKRKVSAAGRAALSAAASARWRRAKAAGRTAL